MKYDIRAVVFDFDGVVVDSEPLYERTAKELFAAYGVVIPPDDWKLYKGLSQDGFFQTACRRYHIQAPLEELKIRDREILKSHFQRELDYIPGFLDFINSLSQDIPTGLVTSSSRQLLDWIFASTAITNHFRYLITADDISRPKPHPEPFEAMNRILGFPPETILVIEDSVNGVLSAKTAGNLTVGLTSSFGASDLQAADFVAASYAEIKSRFAI